VCVFARLDLRTLHQKPGFLTELAISPTVFVRNRVFGTYAPRSKNPVSQQNWGFHRLFLTETGFLGLTHAAVKTRFLNRIGDFTDYF